MLSSTSVEVAVPVTELFEEKKSEERAKDAWVGNFLKSPRETIDSYNIYRFYFLNAADAVTICYI